MTGFGMRSPSSVSTAITWWAWRLHGAQWPARGRALRVSETLKFLSAVAGPSPANLRLRSPWRFGRRAMPSGPASRPGTLDDSSSQIDHSRTTPAETLMHHPRGSPPGSRQA